MLKLISKKILTIVCWLFSYLDLWLQIKDKHMALRGRDTRKQTNQSKKEAKDQYRYNQVPHLTRNTIWESDKTQENQILAKWRNHSVV